MYWSGFPPKNDSNVVCVVTHKHNYVWQSVCVQHDMGILRQPPFEIGFLSSDVMSVSYSNTQILFVSSVWGDNSFAGATAARSQKSVLLKNTLHCTYSTHITDTRKKCEIRQTDFQACIYTSTKPREHTHTHTQGCQDMHEPLIYHQISDHLN